MLPEAEYYPAVKSFISNKFNCIATGCTKGTLDMGLVDVIGAYECGGLYGNNAEVVCVEVKLTTASFGKSLGQILGYSIYGERCYLAIAFHDGETFNNEEIAIANHLGVGLIRIPTDKAGNPLEDETEIVITSKLHEPIPAQKNYILHAIGIVHCFSCGLYVQATESQEINRKTAGPALYNKTSTKRRYLCKKCYSTVLSEREREKLKNVKEGGRKAAMTRKARKGTTGAAQ